MDTNEKPPRSGAVIRRLMLGGLLGTAVGAFAGLGLGCFLCLLLAAVHSRGYPNLGAFLFAMAVTAVVALFGAAAGMVIAWDTRPQPPISG